MGKRMEWGDDHGNTYVLARRATDTVALWCETCGPVPGNQYWPLTKTQWLHENGRSGHKVRRLAFA